MITKAPTARAIVAMAKAAGWTFTPASCRLNGTAAYRMENAASHGYATGPFGRSAALFSISDIAKKIGYAA